MTAATPPLTLGEILDRTVQLYRRNFLLLAGISTPAAALTVLISGSFILFFSHQMFSLGQMGQGSADATQAATQASMLVGVALVFFMLLGLPMLLVVFAMSLSALNYASFHLNQSQKVTIRESYKYAFTHFWRHVGILFLQALLAGVVPYFVFGALILIGVILAALIAKSGAGNSLAPLFVVLAVVLVIAWIVTCVLLWLRFSLAYAASVGENKKAWDSLKRSNRLSEGTRGRIFVMFIMVWLMSLVITFAFAIPMDIVIALAMKSSLVGSHPPAAFMTAIQAANLVAGFLVRIFVMPIYAVALLLFYNDQRTRHEGYDIEQLMSRAGWEQLNAPMMSPIHPDPVYLPETPIVPSPEPRETERPALAEGLSASQTHPEGTGA